MTPQNNLLPLITFVFATTFTPGLNNITCASISIQKGHRSTRGYRFGIFFGFFTIMILCGALSGVLIHNIPAVEPYLRIVGTLYILWLAWHTYRSSYNFSDENQNTMRFKHGMLLQLLNIKVIIYGLMIYTTFLAAIDNNIPWLITSAVLLAGTSYLSNTLWAVGGSGIRKYLKNEKTLRTVNIILAILLVYTAADLSGILG